MATYIKHMEKELANRKERTDLSNGGKKLKVLLYLLTQKLRDREYRTYIKDYI